MPIKCVFTSTPCPPFRLAQATGSLPQTIAWASSLVSLPPSLPKADFPHKTGCNSLPCVVSWMVTSKKKRHVYVLILSLCEGKLMPLNPMASVLRRHRTEDTEEKVVWRLRHREEWCGHKPRSARKCLRGGCLWPFMRRRAHHSASSHSCDTTGTKQKQEEHM